MKYTVLIVLEIDEKEIGNTMRTISDGFGDNVVKMERKPKNTQDKENNKKESWF